MAITNKNGSVTLTPLEDLQNFGRTIRSLPRMAGEALAAHGARLAAQQNAILAQNGRAALAARAAQDIAGMRAGPATTYAYPPVPKVDTTDMDRIVAGDAAMQQRAGVITGRTTPVLTATPVRDTLERRDFGGNPVVDAAMRSRAGVMTGEDRRAPVVAPVSAAQRAIDAVTGRDAAYSQGLVAQRAARDAALAAKVAVPPTMDATSRQTMDDAARAAMLVRPAKPDYQNSRGGTITLPEVLRQYLGVDFGYAGARGGETGAAAPKAPEAPEAPEATAPKGPAPKVRAVDAAQQAIDRVTGRTVGYSEYKVGQRTQAAQDQALENILMSAAMMPRAQFIDYMQAQPAAPKQRSGTDEAIYRLLADYDDNYQRELAAGVPEEQARANRTARIEALKAGWFMPQGNGE